MISASGGVPDLTAVDQLKPATIVVPNIPIEPFLLNKDHGPFMVMARTFRGPEAEKFALALALELRNVHGLPAYILRNLDGLSRETRFILIKAVSRLWKARVIADYVPAIYLDRTIAINALRDVNTILLTLEVDDE